MSINPVSSQSPQYVHSSTPDPRLSAGSDGWMPTALKASAVVIALIASIGAFVALGPIVGIITTCIAGGSLLWLFNPSCSMPHNHPHHPIHPHSPPWYTNFMPLMFSGGHNPVGGGHVPVGGGHVPVGGGHAPVGGGHVHVGGGHTPVGGGHVPVGGGHAPVGGGHVHVGGGHTPVGGGHHHGGHAPVGGHVPVGGGHVPPGGGLPLPPPSGAGGHVPVGRR